MERAAPTERSHRTELRRWVIAQTESGRAPAAMLDDLCLGGWERGAAVQAMQRILSERLAELGPSCTAPPDDAASSPATAPAPVAPALPDVPLAGAPARLDLAGHTVHVLAALREPRVVLLGGFLTDAECRALIDLAAPRMQRSQTVNHLTGGSEPNAARTSSGMFFTRGETALIATIEQRIARLLNWPVDHGEGMQVLHYLPGAEYLPHHDDFDPAHPGTPRILRRGGQRVGTLVMYLDTAQAGGATTFPELGLDVLPQRGNAVFFSYSRTTGRRALHGGAPVLAGEKWVATKWLREGVFI